MTPAHIRTLRVSVSPCEIGVGVLSTSDFTLPTSYHHALHGGDAVRRSRLRLYGVSTLYFISPCIAWWRRSTPQQAAALRRLYFILHFILHN